MMNIEIFPNNILSFLLIKMNFGSPSLELYDLEVNLFDDSSMESSGLEPSLGVACLDFFFS